MNPLNIVLVLAGMVACSQASGVGLGLVALNPAAKLPSGSVSVGVNGAVVAGPSGSVRTDNGLAGLGAAAQLSGPAGDVRTRGGAAALDGPGVGLKGVGIAAPVIATPTLIAAPAVTKVGLGLGLGGAVVGPAGLGIGLNGLGLGLGGAVVGPAGLGIGVNGLGLGLGGAVVGPAGLGIGVNGLGLGLGGLKAL